MRTKVQVKYSLYSLQNNSGIRRRQSVGDAALVLSLPHLDRAQTILLKQTDTATITRLFLPLYHDSNSTVS